MPYEFYANKWDRSRIPIKFRGMRFDAYDHPHGTGRLARQAAEQFVDSFTDHFVSEKRAKAGLFPEDRSNIGKGMLFYGRNGTRKTTLASIVLTEVLYRYPKAEVFYIRLSDWKTAKTDTFTKEITERVVAAKRTLESVSKAHLLVLDDIGQEYRTTTGFTESELHELLRLRYEAALPTIVTTNIDTESFARVYGDSFDSFRHDAFDTYPILGADTRLPVKDKV